MIARFRSNFEPKRRILPSKFRVYFKPPPSSLVVVNSTTTMDTRDGYVTYDCFGYEIHTYQARCCTEGKTAK
jgi:hypothetical protein